MVVVAQGDLFWVDLPDPGGSEAGFRRPVVVVQGDSANRSRIRTVVCVPLTTNMKWAEAPGSVTLLARSTGLPKDSIGRTDLILAVNRSCLTERVGRVPQEALDRMFSGIDVILGRA